MKKYFYCIVAIMLVTSFMCSCNNTSDQNSQDNLISNAESYEGTTSINSDSSEVEDGVLLLWKQKVLNSRGNTTITYTYDYDNNGREIKMISESISSNSTTIKEYNEHGYLCLEYLTATNGIFVQYKTIETDSEGKILSEKYLSEDKKSIINEVVYVYDESGRLISKADKYATYTYTYDDKGGYTVNNTDNEGKSVSLQKYDSKGNILEIDTGYLTSVYTYEEDNMIKIVTTADGEDSSTEFIYNSFNKLEKVVSYDSNNEISQTTYYEYDEHGNEIKKTEKNALGITSFTYISEYKMFKVG